MPFGYHFGPSWLHLGSLWATFGVSFRSLFGGAFFHQKGSPKTALDFKVESVFEAILVPFFIIVHHFSGNVKNRFWQYFTVLLKVFASQRLSFWGPVSVPFSVRFWDPQKGSPRTVAYSTIVSFWVVFGPVGGGFRRGVC